MGLSIDTGVRAADAFINCVPVVGQLNQFVQLCYRTTATVQGQTVPGFKTTLKIHVLSKTPSELVVGCIPILGTIVAIVRLVFFILLGFESDLNRAILSGRSDLVQLCLDNGALDDPERAVQALIRAARQQEGGLFDLVLNKKDQTSPHYWRYKDVIKVLASGALSASQAVGLLTVWESYGDRKVEASDYNVDSQDFSKVIVFLLSLEEDSLRVFQLCQKLQNVLDTPNVVQGLACYTRQRQRSLAKKALSLWEVQNVHRVLDALPREEMFGPTQAIDLIPTFVTFAKGSWTDIATKIIDKFPSELLFEPFAKFLKFEFFGVEEPPPPDWPIVLLVLSGSVPLEIVEKVVSKLAKPSLEQLIAFSVAIEGSRLIRQGDQASWDQCWTILSSWAGQFSGDQIGEWLIQTSKGGAFKLTQHLITHYQDQLTPQLKFKILQEAFNSNNLGRQFFQQCRALWEGDFSASDWKILTSQQRQPAGEIAFL
jgi:hypothetical protein